MFFVLSSFCFHFLPVGVNMKELEKRIKLQGVVTIQRFVSVNCVAREKNRFLSFFLPYFVPIRVSSID